jgi:hypothetical protein
MSSAYAGQISQVTMSDTLSSNSSAASMSSSKILSGRVHASSKLRFISYTRNFGYPASDKVDDATKLVFKLQFFQVIKYFILLSKVRVRVCYR